MTNNEKVEAAKRFESALDVEYCFSITIPSVSENMRYLHFFENNLNGVSGCEQALLAEDINNGHKKINAMGGIDIIPEKTEFQEITDKEVKTNLDKVSADKLDQPGDNEMAKATDAFFAMVDAGTLGQPEKIQHVQEQADDNSMAKAVDDYFSMVDAGTLGQSEKIEREQEQESALTM